MQDSRFDKLAKLLVEYSTRLKRNETVLIEAFDVPDEITVALVRAARNVGAVPFTQIQHARVSREIAMEGTERQLNLIAIHELARMKRMDAYIGLRDSDETSRQKNASGAGPASKKNQMGGAAMANSFHGAARRHEHGSVRRFLF
jgi:leucyl aminopeptidase (aminopeptidase T)